MKNIWVYSGRPSEGAAFLAAEAGFKRSRTGNYVKAGDVIVNWGATGAIPGQSGYVKVLNRQGPVELGRNKLKTFKALADRHISTVPWTTNKAKAYEWLQVGHTVVARKTLTGSEGAGIVIVEKVNELIEAPLYTMYINKVREFRVHATQHGVIDTQWKVHDPKLGPPKSWKVRSYANGFIFQRKGVIPNPSRDALAIQTVQALELDFGGLDIIEDNLGKFYVVEVNTAPGIEGITVSKYAEAIRSLVFNPLVVKPAVIKPYLDPVYDVFYGVLDNPQPVGPGLRPRNLNLGW